MRYKFEYNDLRAAITVVNVVLIMKYGLSIAWFGLIVAFIGMIKDVSVDKKWNGFIMHMANAILNIFFLAQVF